MRFPAIILYLPALLALSAARADGGFQNHESIYEAVKALIGEHRIADDFEVEILPLDRQLRLPLCPGPLEATAPGNALKPGRNTVGVRCKAASAWSVYLSALIRIYRPVVVATQGAQRGDLLGREGLALERRDVSGLRGDFLTSLEAAESLQAIKSVPAGAVLTRRSVAPPPVIKKGDRITISSDKPGFSIRMSGTALTDGALGQKIRIRNQSSGRIIQATVLESGLAAVN